MSVQAAVVPLRPQLVDLARAQLARLPDLVSELVALLCAKDEYYRQLDSTRPGELDKVCEVNLRATLVAFVDGREITVDSAKRTWNELAPHVLPLPAMLRVFRIAGTAVFETLLEQGIRAHLLSPKQTLQFSTDMWQIVDVYSEALASVYGDALAETARADDRARMRLLDSVLEGRVTGQAEIEEAARSLDMPVTGTFVVLFGNAVGQRGTLQLAPAAGYLPRRWRAAWRPGPDHDIGLVSVARPTDLRQLRNGFGTVPVAMGMSTPFATLEEAPEALRRARIARGCLKAEQTGVVGFGDLPLTTLVAGAPALARELARAVLAGILALLPAEQEVLLSTLEAWYAGGGSAKEVGERLYVHPNTVRYRIRRIQELTSRDLTHPLSVAELYMALEAVRLDPAAAPNR